MNSLRKKRKKMQRKLNKEIRNMNKSLKQDSLWRGRFFVFQRYADFIKYSDNSGCFLFATLRFCDKLTGNYWDTVYTYESDCFDLCSLPYLMNKFIVELCDVWHEEPSPIVDKVDYTKITFKESKKM
jgi:hypothetical protein